jgi:hypothetical protein
MGNVIEMHEHKGDSFNGLANSAAPARLEARDCLNCLW